MLLAQYLSIFLFSLVMFILRPLLNLFYYYVGDPLLLGWLDVISPLSPLQSVTTIALLPSLLLPFYPLTLLLHATFAVPSPLYHYHLLFTTLPLPNPSKHLQLARRHSSVYQYRFAAHPHSFQLWFSSFPIFFYVLSRHAFG